MIDLSFFFLLSKIIQRH